MTALHVREWSSAGPVAVLLHGRMGDSGAWWRVGPALVERGYHVLAVDLPGHGRSVPDPAATIDSAADALLRSVPAAPALAIGHSLGGMVLARAAGRLRPGRAVYVDAPLTYRERLDPAGLTRALTRARTERTFANLRRDRPWWHPDDVAAEVEAARRWDVATSVAMTLSAAGQDFAPPTGVPSLVVRPEPSLSVPPAAVDVLRARDIEVRSIPGAGHTVWYGFVEEFLAALEGWI